MLSISGQRHLFKVDSEISWRGGVGQGVWHLNLSEYDSLPGHSETCFLSPDIWVEILLPDWIWDFTSVTDSDGWGECALVPRVVPQGPQTRWLKSTEEYSRSVWRPEVQIKVLKEPHYFRSLQRRLFPWFLQLLWAPGLPQLVRDPNLWLQCHMAISMCLPFFQGHSFVGLRARLAPVWLYLKEFLLQWPYFPIRSRSETVGVRAPVQLFGGHNSIPIRALPSSISKALMPTRLCDTTPAMPPNRLHQKERTGG